LPGTRSGYWWTNFAVEGKTYLKDKDYPNARLLNVTPRFFETLKTPITSGQSFTEARSADPIGRRIRIGGAKSTAAWSTIVGITGDMFSGDQEEPMPPAIFQPFAQARSTFVYIAARTNGPPMAITQAVRCSEPCS